MLSGVSYPVFIDLEVYRPLGLMHSGYASNEAFIPRVAFGYRKSDGNVGPAEFIDMTIPVGAGSQYSSAGDLVKYATALVRGKLLNAESAKAMFAVSAEDYGLGWHIGTRHGEQVIEHIGDINGYGAYMMVIPSSRTTIVVLSNLQGAPVADIARAVERVIFPH